MHMKVILLSLLCAGVMGCGTSSPRFGSNDASKKAERHERKSTGPRFTSKHVEEETKEDDRKVDVKRVAARFSSASPAPARGASPSKSKSEPAHPSETRPIGKINDQKMMDVILSYLGTPYVYGGDSRSGIDCSAFTSFVYGQSVNKKLPRTTSGQSKEGKAVPLDEIKFGDLLFFNTTGTNPSHVGIYIGDDLFAHASEAFGVTISSIESSYYKKRFTEARRVIE